MVDDQMKELAEPESESEVVIKDDAPDFVNPRIQDHAQDFPGRVPACAV
jgi:hypothetical protein